MLQMRQDITGKNTNIATMNNTRQAAKSTPRTVVEIIMKRAAGVCVCVSVCILCLHVYVCVRVCMCVWL